MNKIFILLALVIASLVTGCGTPNNGYFFARPGVDMNVYAPVQQSQLPPTQVNRGEFLMDLGSYRYNHNQGEVVTVDVGVGCCGQREVYYDRSAHSDTHETARTPDRYIPQYVNDPRAVQGGYVQGFVPIRPALVPFVRTK